jgi:hypothetical protein
VAYLPAALLQPLADRLAALPVVVQEALQEALVDEVVQVEIVPVPKQDLPVVAVAVPVLMQCLNPILALISLNYNVGLNGIGIPPVMIEINGLWPCLPLVEMVVC